MREFVRRNLSGKRVLILFLVTNLVYGFMLLVTIPQVMSFSGGMKLLDMLPTGYDAQYVKTLFDLLGEKGRNVYLCNQLPVDMIYPFLFGISYGLVLAYFFQRLNKLDGPLFYFCYMPLIGGVFDYLENIGIISLLNQYPDLSQSLIRTTNVFSLVKSSATTAYFIVLAITLVTVGINYSGKFIRSNKS